MNNMAYPLYPRLPLPTAQTLAAERAALSIESLVALSALYHEAAHFAPTGGNKVLTKPLGQLQKQVRSCAELYGYPGKVETDSARRFDTACGILLFENMHLYPSEASHIEMWAFVTCVLLPDVVRWRFPGEITSPERFIGSDRGLRRSTFGRLWWRVYLLHQPGWENPYELLNWLVEDELVQITERNSIAASPELVKLFCLSFVRTVGKSSHIPRRLLMRESVKRVRRLLSVISFAALDTKMVQTIIDGVFSDTMEALSQTSSLHTTNTAQEIN
jgi:hypothetical protein